jgi:hypothetical protein
VIHAINIGIYEIKYVSVNSNLWKFKENMVSDGLRGFGQLLGFDSGR